MPCPFFYCEIMNKSSAKTMNLPSRKKLPRGWRWEKLKDLGKLSQGGTPSTDIPEYWGGLIPFITDADITNLFVSKGRSYLSAKGYESGKTQQCNPSDLLIVSRTRVGRVGIAETRLGISQDVSALQVNKGNDVKYLAMFLKSISRKLEDACQGSTIKGLTRGFIENILIPLCLPLDEQVSIANMRLSAKRWCYRDAKQSGSRRILSHKEY